MTVNCSLPAYITVRGSGFLANISSAARFYSDSPAYWILVAPSLSAAAVARGQRSPYIRSSALFPTNDTYFVFQLYYVGQGVLAENEPFSLTVIVGSDYPQLTTTLAPFVGVSVNSVTPPVITSISGCPVVVADNQSVSQCLPELNVLTLTGRGFLSWQRTYLAVDVGDIRTYVTLSLDNTSVSSSAILSDTSLLISLATSYYPLLAEKDFGAPPRPFYVSEVYSDWRSSRMSIQFAPLPPPSYTSVAPYIYQTVNLLPGCVWGPNRTTIVNCTAGHSAILIRGQYLYQVTAAIGGQPMALFGYLASSPRFHYLTTPLYNFQPGLLYDLVLTSASGSVTLPNYVSFRGSPTIVSAACRDPLLPIDISSLACEVGETATMNGPYLPPPTTAFTVTVYSAYSEQNVTCSNPRYNSEYQLACDMLAPGLPSTTARDIWSAPAHLGATQPLLPCVGLL